MSLPILFLIFNRKDLSQQSFKSIQDYRPDTLYIAADGPRINKVGDKEACEDTRKAILKMIDWPCDVKTLFRNENLGCAKAVSSAIDWFFENEEFGVIIEDDILLSPDFYVFAKVIDARYRNDNKIMCINAQCLCRKLIMKNSYSFSTMSSPWGWATWRRAWARMDMSMQLFPRNSLKKHIKSFGFTRGLLLYFYYWRHDYKIITSGGDISSWATRWAFNIFANNGLVVVPSKNLALNVGCTGQNGTHYNSDDEDLYPYLKLEKLPNEISHPSKIEPDKMLRKIENKDFIRIRFKGILKKIRKYKIFK